METVLRKYLWAIDLVVIALCSLFAAQASATWIESQLERTTVTTKRAPRPATAAAAATVYSKQVEDILNRNVFCSACPPILKKAEAEGTAGPPPPPPLQRSSMNAKVLAIMYAPAPANPHWSIAIIRDNDEKTTGPYSIDSKLRDATITDIQEARVYLDFGGGRVEYLDLLDQPTPPPGAPVATAGPAAPADPLTAELDKGIKKTGEHNYEVQRSTLDSLLGNMAALSKGARIVPEVRDGRPAGFRLFSIRPEGPFAKIGLQNGDVISAINGLEMTSPDQALAVYTKLKTANHLSVAVERGGQKITKDYNIR